ncbi:MAG: hypothetical protein Q9M92_04790 [Enterobacterales bacterium]|nr:hypothetical protein [Enterobacterales bacterium]
MKRMFLVILLLMQMPIGGVLFLSLASQQPIVNAGPDRLVNEQNLIILQAKISDNNATPANVSWRQTKGTKVALSETHQASLRFVTPQTTRREQLTFEFSIIDDSGAAVSDSVNVTVKPVNAAPSADGGLDQWLSVGSKVKLKANGTDIDGQIVAYSWRQTSGITVALSNSRSASPSFKMPEIDPLQPIQFELTVTDNEGATATDQVSIYAVKQIKSKLN